MTGNINTESIKKKFQTSKGKEKEWNSGRKKEKDRKETETGQVKEK